MPRDEICCSCARSTRTTVAVASADRATAVDPARSRRHRQQRSHSGDRGARRGLRAGSARRRDGPGRGRHPRRLARHGEAGRHRRRRRAADVLRRRPERLIAAVGPAHRPVLLRSVGEHLPRRFATPDTTRRCSIAGSSRAPTASSTSTCGRRHARSARRRRRDARQHSYRRVVHEDARDVFHSYRVMGTRRAG